MLSTRAIKQGLAKQTKLYAGGNFRSYFKYCSNDSKVLEGVFRNQKIRFTQPRALDDPLEFNPTMRFNDSQSKYQVYDLNGIVFPSIELFFRGQAIESQINAYGILSLTKIPNSFDMWSQYANGHRGFVIEWKDDFWRHSCMKSRAGDEYPVRKVNYVEDYAVNLDDLVTTNHEILLEVLHKELFFKKTSRWKHEHEYRMVRPLSDSPAYKPPKTKYPYADVSVYLFPFDWKCVLSVILGANMPTENKRLIAECCDKHDIPLSQALIIRDHKDWFGRSSTVYIVSLDRDADKDRVLQAKPRLFCTDTISLGNRSTVKIAKITDLPYYKGYEKVVDQLYRNLKADGDV